MAMGGSWYGVWDINVMVVVTLDFIIECDVGIENTYFKE